MRFQAFDVFLQLLVRRYPHHVPTDHLKGSLCRLSARPNRNQHACNNRAICLNFNATCIQAQLMTTTQNVLEHPEKEIGRAHV